MGKLNLLHFATPETRVSPFDVNMGYDAGWNAITPYSGVGLDEISGFTQDAIFSRGPKGVKHTGIFIGGRDPFIAAKMLTSARKAMVPPFEVSVFADPSGAYTTAAAMVAQVENTLSVHHDLTLSGLRVVIFGGTGSVGTTAAILCAQAGAKVIIPGHNGISRAAAIAESIKLNFDVSVQAVDASSEDLKSAIVGDADIVLATAKAGVRVLSSTYLAAAKKLLVAADINAVPPSGIEGINVMDNAVPLNAGSGCALGIGPLAIGNIKYKVQQRLLQSMLSTEKPVYIGFQECLSEARQHGQ